MAADAYPTVLRDPSAIEGDFVVEQEVTMTHERGENSFRAVLQKRGDTITLVGLAPHGGRAFVLTQVGGAPGGEPEITFDSSMPRELPFPPRYMLHDIHRTWFMAEPGERDGERLRVELDDDGRVVERRFTRDSGEPAGDIVVRYPGGLEDGAPVTARPPDEVTLENGWFGYTARIRTLSWQRIE